jgi:DNA-binding protein H-NS
VRDFLSGAYTMPRQMSLKTLEARIHELQQRAEALKKREKPGIAQLRKLLKKYRLDLADCKIALSGSPKKRASQLAGRKLKPKYRNPATKGETWSGRGLKPKWMVAAIKGGKKVEDFLIKKV